jgi:vacuolar iron transporter family protein
VVVGVAASGASEQAVLASGIGGAVAGAMSMAAGESVSVQSQADTEQADVAIERRSLSVQPLAELAELTEIYIKRGLSRELARQVAEELSGEYALLVQARDELGITEAHRARPIQAALASAGAFSVGSILPLAGLLIAPAAHIEPAIVAVTLLSLLLTGALAAHTGGVSKLRGVLRLVFWGALAMLATNRVGEVFQSQV